MAVNVPKGGQKCPAKGALDVRFNPPLTFLPFTLTTVLASTPSSWELWTFAANIGKLTWKCLITLKLPGRQRTGDQKCHHFKISNWICPLVNWFQFHLVDKGLETWGPIIKVVVSKCHHCVVQQVWKLKNHVKTMMFLGCCLMFIWLVVYCMLAPV